MPSRRCHGWRTYRAPARASTAKRSARPSSVPQAVTAFQAQLRVLQAAPRSAITEPSGHAVRMDALHLIRSAAEFADTIERDAQEAAAKQVGKAEQEIRESQMELQQREAEIARIRQETERQRGEIMNAARNEAREILTKANRDSSSELHDADARQPAPRAVAPPGDRAHELRPRRGRADPGVGPRAGRRHRSAGAHGRRAASVRRGHGEAAIQEAVDAIVRAAQSSVPKPSG